MEAKLRPGVLARLSSVVIFSWLLFGWAQIFGLPPGIEDAHAATVAQDSFTGGSGFLENHTPDVGTGWTIGSQGAESWEISSKESNHANEKSGNSNVVRENTDIGADAMDVTLVVKSTDCGATDAWGGPAGRIPSGAFDGNNYFAARLIGDGSTCDVELVKNVGGTLTVLGTYQLNASSNTDVTLKLSLRTNSQEVFVDTVSRITASDSSLAGNTFAGMVARKDKLVLDDFLSESSICASSTVTDPGYVGANAQSAQGIVYWSSPNPVLILRKENASITEAPTDGQTYAVNDPIGAATVVYNGSAAATSFTESGLTNGTTTYHYKVFAKDTSNCYAPGLAVKANPEAAGSDPAWSYMLAGGPVLKPGIAGVGTIYTAGNPSRIVSLSTTNGTQSWQPAGTSAPIQSWLTWLPATSDTSWWNASWLSRRKIVFNNSASSENLPNFPVLVRLTSAEVNYGETHDQGFDLRFIDADGVAELSYEIEQWDETGTSVVWVKVPQIDAGSTGDHIWMYYNNSSATTDVQDAAGVWSNGYVGVWHLHDDFVDATSNPNDGTNFGSTDIAGKFGDAQDFDGSNDYILIGDSASLSFGTGDVTFELWVKNRNLQSSGSKFLEKKSVSASAPEIVLEAYPSDNVAQYYVQDSGFTDASAVGTSNINDNVWHHLVGVKEGNNLTVYVDGSSEASGSATYAGNLDEGDVRIGHSKDGGARATDGLIDEVRISNTARSADWIAAQYKSMAGSFVSFAVEDQWWNTSWRSRKKITFDNSLQTTDALDNFPVLVKLTSGNFAFTKAQSNGEDIRFVESDNSAVLKYEIERWDNVGAVAEIWVKVPNIPAGSTTDHIWMYYNNTSAVYEQTLADEQAVWSNGYVGVWHLKESGTGTADEFVDSSGSSNHGQGGGGTAAAVPTQVTTGKIANAQDFDGSDDRVSRDAIAAIDDSSLTAMVWAKSSNWNTADLFLLSQKAGTNPTTEGWNFGHRLNKIQAYIGDGTTQIQFDSDDATKTLTANQWHHFALVIDRGTGNATVYVDATSPVTKSIAGFGSFFRSTNVFVAGATHTSQHFNGQIDEARISTTARTADWIAAQYKSMTGAFATLGPEHSAGAGGGTERVLGGDQTGKVYAVTTAAGETSWEVALTGAETVEAATVAQVRDWSSAAFQAAYTGNVLFAATRKASSTDNKVFAIRLSSGEVIWTFDKTTPGASDVDYIVGIPWLDYTRDRLYVASRAGGGGQRSLWVIDTLTGNPVACNGTDSADCKLGHLESSPTLSYDGTTIYVGETDGDLHAITAATLALKWTLAVGSAINGFVWEDWTTAGRLYFTTADDKVRCVKENATADGADPCTGWTLSTVAGAYTPLLLDKLFVGSSDGKVHQINLTTGVDEKEFPAGATTLDGTQVGDVSTETGNEIFVGTFGGKVFRIDLVSGALP